MAAGCTDADRSGGVGPSSTSPPAVGAAAPAPAPPTELPCAADVPSGWTCGTFTRPLDEARPDGPTIDLEVRRRDATATPSLGLMTINLGGPGIPTADQAVALAERLPPQVRDRFDIVLMDPRATAHAAPVACPTTPPGVEAALVPYPAPADAAAVRSWGDAMTTANTKCVDEIGPGIANMGTWQSAGDLDALRQALGSPQLTYLGYSYGTRLGAVYAQRFPGRVRSMVLDSSVNPSGGNLEFGAGKARAFSTIFDRWGTWCDSGAAPTPRCGTATGALAAYEAARSALPLMDPAVPGLTWDVSLLEAVAVNLLSGTDLPTWARLAPALELLGRGDPSGMRSLLGIPPGSPAAAPTGPVADANDALVTINCADMSDRPTAAEVADLARRSADRGLRGAGYGAAIAGQCLGWPAAARPVDDVRADPAATVLVVGSTGDPLTAFDWNRAMADALGGVLVTWNGLGHAVAYLRGSACVDGLVSAYLLDPSRIPPPGTSCDAS
ncbi:MAG: alpha/beta hydrolase [Microthrixaceae bacterium]